MLPPPRSGASSACACNHHHGKPTITLNARRLPTTQVLVGVRGIQGGWERKERGRGSATPAAGSLVGMALQYLVPPGGGLILSDLGAATIERSQHPGGRRGGGMAELLRSLARGECVGERVAARRLDAKLTDDGL
jgi:hypothetical protein